MPCPSAESLTLFLRLAFFCERAKDIRARCAQFLVQNPFNPFHCLQIQRVLLQNRQNTYRQTQTKAKSQPTPLTFPKKTMTRTRDIDPIQSPLFGLFLQLFFLSFTIYHVRVNETVASKIVVKLCVTSQFLGVLYILMTTFYSELEPLLDLGFHESPEYCQLFYWDLGVFILIGYYGTLIIFWLWRLKLAFSQTMWALSDTFFKVGVLCPVFSCCLVSVVMELYICVCVCVVVGEWVWGR